MDRADAILLLITRTVQQMTLPDKVRMISGDFFVADLESMSEAEAQRAIDTVVEEYGLDGVEEQIISMGVREYETWRNEYLQECLLKSGLKIDGEVSGQPRLAPICPCCKYRSLPEDPLFHICSVCFWEYEGNLEPDHFSAINGMTLKEAIANFDIYGAKDRKSSINADLLDPDAKRKYVRLSEE